MLQIVVSLMIIDFDYNMFIVQATGLKKLLYLPCLLGNFVFALPKEPNQEKPIGTAFLP